MSDQDGLFDRDVRNNLYYQWRHEELRNDDLDVIDYQKSNSPFPTGNFSNWVVWRISRYAGASVALVQSAQENLMDTWPAPTPDATCITTAIEWRYDTYATISAWYTESDPLRRYKLLQYELIDNCRYRDNIWIHMKVNLYYVFQTIATHSVKNYLT